jgi:hypothetical protein
LLRPEPFGFGLNPGKGHPRLYPPLSVDEVNLHIDRGRELGLNSSQLSQLHDFPGLCPGRARGAVGTFRSVRHEGIVACRRLMTFHNCKPRLLPEISRRASSAPASKITQRRAADLVGIVNGIT